MAWQHSYSGPEQNDHTTSHFTWTMCKFKSSYTSIASRFVLLPKEDEDSFPVGCPFPELAGVRIVIHCQIHKTRRVLPRYFSVSISIKVHQKPLDTSDACPEILAAHYDMEDTKLTYVRQPEAPVLSIYMDAAWAGAPADRISTTGAVVYKYHGNPISWICHKQKTVSPSTSVAAYNTLSYAFTAGMSFYALIEKEIKQSITPIPSTMNSLNPVAPSK